MYLYNMVNIKKKRAPRLSNKLHGYKPISSFYNMVEVVKSQE